MLFELYIGLGLSVEEFSVKTKALRCSDSEARWGSDFDSLLEQLAPWST